MKDFIPYGKQFIDEADIEAVVEVLRSPMLTQGPVVEKFERAIADYVGATYAVAFSSGTAALHAAYAVAGVGAEDEVLMPAMTFAATANAARYQGATPVFVDINEMYTVDANQIRSKITNKTKAVVSVDFTGQPADYDTLREIAHSHGLVYISDGAHSLGARYKGALVGTQADMTMFSFHPVKPITTGEGGVIVTNSADYAERLARFRTHGIEKGTSDEPWFYEMLELGMNYRLSDIHAALGLSQLGKIEDFLQRRRQIAKMYTEAFEQVKEVITPNQLANTESGWHLYSIQLSPDAPLSRKEMFHALREQGVGVHVHYIPVYLHPYYKELGYEAGLCPATESLYENLLTLPINPSMTDADIEHVIVSVKKILRNHVK